MALPHHGDSLGVPAERLDVVFDPMQCCHHVEQGVVTRSIAVSSRQETWKDANFRLDL